MTAEEFSINLMNSAPTSDDMARSKATKAFADRLLASFRCEMKVAILAEKHEDPLIDLLNRYNVSQLEIGMIRLMPPCRLSERYIKVGSMEVDPVVLDETSGKIVVLDHASLEHVVGVLAVSGSRFLDALVLLAIGTTQHLRPDHFHRTPAEWVVACATAAGVEFDPSLYEILIGQ